MALPTPVDVVVVSYNSRDRLRACVEPFTTTDDVSVFVVDNASNDGSLETIADLRVTAISRENNGGFAVACNVGWQHGASNYVLFLNPDAGLDSGSLERLVEAAENDLRVGAVAPRIVDDRGELDFSIRSFPRLRSTFAQAMFLHRLFRSASWSDEVVRDEDMYSRRSIVEWASGACLLVRRRALEVLNGFDEDFFMYCEDKDLCRRLRDYGYSVMFEPTATCAHVGGASAPRSSLLPVLAASRVRYAQKHRRSPGAELERIGIVLGALTHALLGRRAYFRGHLDAAAVAAGLRGPRLPARTPPVRSSVGRALASDSAEG